MNGRIERELEWQVDERLIELFRDAEVRRWARWKEAAQIIAAWIGLFAVATIICVGVIKSIGAW